MATATRLPLGLILDWGGVLTTPVNDSFAVFVEREGIEHRSFARAMRLMHDEPGSPLHQVESGDIRREQFEEALAASFATLDGTPVSPEGLLERMFGQLRRNDPVRTIVADARARGWRTTVLSNSWGMAYDEEDLGSLTGLVLLSDRIGLRKPDPAAFLYAVHMLGLTPDACVMVDDMRRNALAASALGMAGFQYRPGTEADLTHVLHAWESRLEEDDL